MNQDSLYVVMNFLGSANDTCFGVCDGHGENGGQVSQFIKKLVPKALGKYVKHHQQLANEQKGRPLNFKDVYSE